MLPSVFSDLNAPTDRFARTELDTLCDDPTDHDPDDNEDDGELAEYRVSLLALETYELDDHGIDRVVSEGNCFSSNEAEIAEYPTPYQLMVSNPGPRETRVEHNDELLGEALAEMALQLTTKPSGRVVLRKRGDEQLRLSPSVSVEDVNEPDSGEFDDDEHPTDFGASVRNFAPMRKPDSHSGKSRSRLEKLQERNN